MCNLFSPSTSRFKFSLIDCSSVVRLVVCTLESYVPSHWCHINSMDSLSLTTLQKQKKYVHLAYTANLLSFISEGLANRKNTNHIHFVMVSI